MIEKRWVDETPKIDGRRPTLSMEAARTVTYDVRHTERHIFDLSEQAFTQAVGSRRVLLVVDEALWANYGSGIDRYLQANVSCAGVLRLPGDESTKSLDQVAAVCAQAFDLGLPRNGAMVAVGGGTILDMVGFAASIYRRGIDFVRVPTTLIGMIDVGVGIKQAVNFGSKKNALGSFYAPTVTLNDGTFLSTLSRRNLACGLAEALKMALICDGDLFLLIEEYGGMLVGTNFTSPPDVALTLLLRAEKTMMDQLRPNLFEHELRRLVDFGHTFSPVIEIVSNYSVPHGEAVALDMLLSISISVGRCLCDPSLLERMKNIYRDIGLPLEHESMDPDMMLRALSEARAHRGGNLNLVVPLAPGEAVFLQDVNRNEIISALDRFTIVGTN